MRSQIVAELVSETIEAVGQSGAVAILGRGGIAIAVYTAIRDLEIGPVAIFSAAVAANASNKTFRPLSDLAQMRADVLVVAADEEKEDLLLEAISFVQGLPRVILAGYGHYRRPNLLIEEIQSQLLVPSLANGYPQTLSHIAQCLSNAARLGLEGVVAEFGMFKGGTTMLISKIIEQLGVSWPVIGFDTFNGFPARRNLLDMYNHPGCVFSDEAAVRRQLEGRNVEIVTGDIVETCHRLDQEEILLAFIDTDNYTPAREALAVCKQRVVLGGVIVFDHFTGVDRFKYTLGERIAALPLLEDPRFFHLEGTGVFYRQR